MPDLNIILTARDTVNYQFYNDTIIVIDTLRASTTIITALVNGARAVIPFDDQIELQEYRNKSSDDDCLMCGEDQGRPIQGFDLGNSPDSYRKELVLGKKILLKTSNGTGVLRQLNSSNGKVLIGALINSKAVSRAAIEKKQNIDLVCAGTKGSFSLEDFITAGRYAYLLTRNGWQGNDLTVAAARIFEDNQQYEELINLFHHSYNGQNLLNLGYKSDIEFSARLDVFDVVPYLSDSKIVV